MKQIEIALSSREPPAKKDVIVKQYDIKSASFNKTENIKSINIHLEPF